MTPTIFYSFVICLAASVVKAEVTKIGEDTNSRVVGGLQAKQDQFPYQAQIKWKGDVSYQYLFCGASIIHHKYVLTSARCVYDKWPYDLYVNIGSVVSQWGWDIEIQRVILRDPYYQLDAPNDIALIELASYIEFHVDISPISYNSGINQPEVVNASGFGWPIYAGEVSPALQYVTLDTISNEECQKYWGSRVTPDKICTMPEDGRGTCGRDAGGPLAYYGLQIGVIGWTDYECDNGKPELHTRVAPYANWISNIISGRLKPACSEFTHMTNFI